MDVPSPPGRPGVPEHVNREACKDGAQWRISKRTQVASAGACGQGYGLRSATLCVITSPSERRHIEVDKRSLLS